MMQMSLRLLLALSLLVGSSARAELEGLDQLDEPVQMLESEFDPSLLEHLTPPTQPPPRVTLPPVVIKKSEWGSSQSGITRPATLVIRKPEQWLRLWELAVAPYSHRLRSKPEIDFAKDMVVGVFIGEKQNPNYSVEIRSARVDNHGADAMMKVNYKIDQQMQAVFNPPFPVQPFYLKKVPAFPGRVVFQEL